MAAELIVILGPTASGKSAVAMEAARRLGAAILSVDSMQVYRGMDIGTAKPSPAERDEIAHHGIDVLEPTQPFTAAEFLRLAEQVIAQTRGPLILTGGTPLYYKSLFEGMFDGPPANAEIRAELDQLESHALHDMLRTVDRVSAERLHVNDRKRLTRAIEIHRLTGTPISQLQQQWTDTPKLRFEAKWFGLHWERSEFNRRINARAKQMMSGGWLEEVRHLLATHGQLGKTAGEATGYAELIAHLQGRQTLDDAFEQIKIGTRQLAKRQMAWFRRFTQVKWLKGDQPAEALATQVLESA